LLWIGIKKQLLDKKNGFKAEILKKNLFMDTGMLPMTAPYLLWRQEDADADNNPPDQLEVAGEGVLVHLLLPTRISNHKHKTDNVVVGQHMCVSFI
jgi:hypothetical protein